MNTKQYNRWSKELIEQEYGLLICPEFEEQAVIVLDDNGAITQIGGQCKAKDFKKQFESIQNSFKHES